MFCLSSALLKEVSKQREMQDFWKNEMELSRFPELRQNAAVLREAEGKKPFVFHLSGSGTSLSPSLSLSPAL